MESSATKGTRLHLLWLHAISGEGLHALRSSTRPRQALRASGVHPHGLSTLPHQCPPKCSETHAHPQLSGRKTAQAAEAVVREANSASSGPLGCCLMFTYSQIGGPTWSLSKFHTALGGPWRPQILQACCALHRSALQECSTVRPSAGFGRSAAQDAALPVLPMLPKLLMLFRRCDGAAESRALKSEPRGHEVLGSKYIARLRNRENHT